MKGLHGHGVGMHGGSRGNAKVSGLDRGKDHVHFAYIKYIQEFEGYDKAIELSVFGERILNSQLSDTPRKVAISSGVLPDCPQSKIKKTKTNQEKDKNQFFSQERKI